MARLLIKNPELKKYRVRAKKEICLVIVKQ